MTQKNFVGIVIFFIATIAFILILLLPILNKTAIRTTINTKAQTRPTPVILLPSIIPIKLAATASTSANWIAYNNQQYGFSLNYPQDWQLQEQPNVFGIEIQKVDKQGLGFSISIRVLDNPNKLSIRDFAIAQAYPRENGIYDNPQLVSVGGVTGYKLMYLPKSLLIDLFLPYKDGVINIFAGGDIDLTSETNKLYNDITSKILNSLNFYH